jgi:dihydroorotase
MAREGEVDDAALQSQSKITPWNRRKLKGLPLHTLVRGRFVMKDRTLVASARGWGRSVHSAQRMQAPAPRHTDTTMTAIVQPPKS